MKAAATDWPAAAGRLTVIRRSVLANLILGLIATLLASVAPKLL